MLCGYFGLTATADNRFISGPCNGAPWPRPAAAVPLMEKDVVSVTGAATPTEAVSKLQRLRGDSHSAAGGRRELDGVAVQLVVGWLSVQTLSPESLRQSHIRNLEWSARRRG